MTQDEPIYNIGAVARMTGIPAATLRVWERRYGFPDTARTEGGHRLYSEGDDRRLRWVKERVDGGMQIRQAVKALRALEQTEAFLPLVQEVPSSWPLPSLESLEDGVSVDTHIERLQKGLFEVLVEHNLDRANEILGEALAHYAPEDVMVHIIRPTLSEVGTGWETGELSVATEHLATHYLRERLLVWLRTGPPLYETAPTVLACAPGEYHEGGLMIFGALLRRRRWPVAYLGQSTPLSELAAFVREVQPLAVVMVSMTAETAEALEEWPRWLPEAEKTGRPIVAFGGRVFNTHPEWRARVPGLFLGSTLTEGVETLERMLRRIRSSSN